MDPILDRYCPSCGAPEGEAISNGVRYCCGREEYQDGGLVITWACQRIATLLGAVAVTTKKYAEELPGSLISFTPPTTNDAAAGLKLIAELHQSLADLAGRLATLVSTAGRNN